MTDRNTGEHAGKQMSRVYRDIGLVMRPTVPFEERKKFMKNIRELLTIHERLLLEEARRCATE